MKSKCNLFSLLARGVTTTHPLCSVFILSLIFVFCSFSISVRATVSDIPEMTDWQFQKAIDAYADLTDDQKDIANFLAGAQGYAFAGISQSNLNSNFSSFSNTIDSAREFGKKMFDQLGNFSDTVVSGMVGVTNDLSNFLGNSVSYAKTRSESFSAWLGNVGIDYNSTSQFRVQFGKDQAKSNIDFFGDEGLYNWQFYPSSFNHFVWNTIDSASQSAINQYNNAFASNSANYDSYIKVNRDYSLNCYLFSNYFDDYHYVFLNTSNNTAYLCNSSGNTYFNGYAQILCYDIGGNSITNTDTGIYSTTYSFSPSDSLVSIAAYIFNHFNVLVYFTGTTYQVDSSIFTVLVGSSFSDAQVLRADGNFNLSPTSQYVTVNSPNNVIYLDINGFMHDLYDNPTIIYNYVINNSIDNNGEPVDSDDFSPISKFVDIPLSGISIGSDFFKLPNGLSLFDTYIADLWRNTKDMVLYCADILNVFTLEDGGGLAYIVYGGIAVGVIGGIFSKFLL